MFDFVCIFTTGGIVLWYKAFCDMKPNELVDSNPRTQENLGRQDKSEERNLQLLNVFVKNILLEEKTAMHQYNYQDSVLKWKVQNDLNLVFAIIYKEILQLGFVDELLEMIRYEFVTKFYSAIPKQGDVFMTLPTQFDKHFQFIWKKWEVKAKELQGPKQMKSFNQTSKGKKLKEKNGDSAKEYTMTLGIADSKQKEDDDESKQAVLSAREALKSKFKRSQTTTKVSKSITEQFESKTPREAKESKESRNWFGVSDKISAKDMAKIDVSLNKGGEIDIQRQKDIYLGGDDDELEGFYDSEDEIDFENFKKGKKGTAPQEGGVFNKLTSAFKNLTGNKVLTEEDIRPILKDLSNSLMEKNVAQDITEQLCQSVTASLVDKKTDSFTTVKTTVKAALTESIKKLLTPKRNIDILKEALSARKRGQVYSMVFIGVNGVGKSTSLAKTAYYLKTKGNLKVMIAGCDNFRSGAIEQLQTHASCLDVPLYQKGYKDDAAIIAKEALQEAKSKGYDVVLIDTAGRMQGNEKLMRALAKLVHINNPDVVLFVGEALVGNDAIDQLTKFNQCLIDYAVQDANPRTIDGIILTKFDTVDEKVGTALNMVYTTGKPIVFVGVGQKYPHLRKLNVQTVMNALMG